MKQLLAAAALTAVISTSAGAQTTFSAKRMDSLFSSLSVHNKSMCSVAMRKGGRLIYQKSIGSAVLKGAKKIPATANTEYRIGSITKMFTAVIIYQLIEEKQLSLSAPLARWFPAVPNAADITVAQLLNHHSGIANFTEDSTFNEYGYRPNTEAEMLARISKSKPVFKPGEKAEYSNTNYLLLAYIAERITGKTYAELVQQRVAGRIGLKHTRSLVSAKDSGAYSAVSYNMFNNKWDSEAQTDPAVSLGAGSIVSTPADLTEFITALFKGKLISDSSLQYMKTLHDSYGSGIFPVPFNEHHGFGHNGRIDNFTSLLTYFPDDSVAIAIVVNGQNYPLNDIGIGMLSIYYGDKDYKIPDFMSKAVSADVLAKYEGVYSGKEMTMKITVSQKDGKLIAQAEGQSAFALSADTDTKFSFSAAGIEIDFVKNADGSTNKFTLHQGGAQIHFEK